LFGKRGVLVSYASQRRGKGITYFVGSGTSLPPEGKQHKPLYLWTKKRRRPFYPTGEGRCKTPSREGGKREGVCISFFEKKEGEWGGLLPDFRGRKKGRANYFTGIGGEKKKALVAFGKGRTTLFLGMKASPLSAARER